MSEKKNLKVIEHGDIRSKIYTIRGIQVMLDRDLAKLYQIETRVLKQAVRRNRERFPDDFMFELDDEDINNLVSQIVIPSKSYFGGAKPFAFTEHGVSMLASVLKTPIAVKISIGIVRAFVEMRKFILKNAEIFQRLDKLEQKQLETDKNFEKIFKALESKNSLPHKGIFFEGQIFNSYKFVSDIIRSAKKSIILIDNYVDDTVLTLLTKRRRNVNAIIYTQKITKQLKLDLEKHNAQYSLIDVKEFKYSHDRFMIIDNKRVYHFGASLKDLGKKWFAFSKFEKESFKILKKLNEYNNS